MLAMPSIGGTTVFSKVCAATDPPVKPKDDDDAWPVDDN